jgi:hypothetical protein
MWWHLGKPLPKIFNTFFCRISSSLSNDTKINMFYTFNTSSFDHTSSYVNDYSKLRDCKLHFVTSIVQNFAIYDFYSLICSPTLKMDAKMDAMLQLQYQDGMSMYQLHFESKILHTLLISWKFYHKYKITSIVCSNKNYYYIKRARSRI